MIRRSRSLQGAEVEGEDHCQNSPAHTAHNNQFHTTFGHSPPLSFFSGCNGTKILKGPPLPPPRRPSASGAVQDFMNPPKLDRLSTVPDGGPSLARVHSRQKIIAHSFLRRVSVVFGRWKRSYIFLTLYVIVFLIIPQLFFARFGSSSRVV